MMKIPNTTTYPLITDNNFFKKLFSFEINLELMATTGVIILNSAKTNFQQISFLMLQQMSN